MPEKLDQATASQQFRLRLVFKNQSGDEMVFYDARGREIWLRFRHDRFDQKNSRIAPLVVRGLPYQVSFVYTEKVLPEQKKLTLSPENRQIRIREPLPLYRGILLQVNSALVDDIRL